LICFISRHTLINLVPIECSDKGKTYLENAQGTAGAEDLIV